MNQKRNPDLTYEDLAIQLGEMVKRDAEMMRYYGENISSMPIENLNQFRDSVFRANGEKAKNIFAAFGFPGIDRVGKTGAKDFWLIVQHSDYDLEFQEQVLEAMREEVDKENANSQDYAFLVDRVRKNKGQKQLYGTQITHNTNMWAIPEPLEDSLLVNERRRAIGLAPIETYLNAYMKMHFEMNGDYYRQQGITEPLAYEKD